MSELTDRETRFLRQAFLMEKAFRMLAVRFEDFADPIDGVTIESMVQLIHDAARMDVQDDDEDTDIIDQVFIFSLIDSMFPEDE